MSKEVMKSLKSYLEKIDSSGNLYIKESATSPQEISDLFSLVNRDIKCAAEAEKLIEDWHYGIAYNAALKLCTILLRANNLRISGGGHHFLTIMSLSYFLGEEYEEEAAYLNKCRKVRNRVEYECPGGVSFDHVDELIDFTRGLKTKVEEWMYMNHTDLMGESKE